MLKLCAFLLLGYFLCGAEAHTKTCTCSYEKQMGDTAAQHISVFNTDVSVATLLGVSLVSLQGTGITTDLVRDKDNQLVWSANVSVAASVAGVQVVGVAAHVSCSVIIDVNNGSVQWKFDKAAINASVSLTGVLPITLGFSTNSFWSAVLPKIKECVKLLVSKIESECNTANQKYTEPYPVGGKDYNCQANKITHNDDNIETETESVCGEKKVVWESKPIELQEDESSCTAVPGNAMDFHLEGVTNTAEWLVDTAKSATWGIASEVNALGITVGASITASKCNMMNVPHQLEHNVSVTLSAGSEEIAKINCGAKVDVKPVRNGHFVGYEHAGTPTIGSIWVEKSTEKCGCSTSLADGLVSELKAAAAACVSGALGTIGALVNAKPPGGTSGPPLPCTAEPGHIRSSCGKM